MTTTTRYNTVRKPYDRQLYTIGRDGWPELVGYEQAHYHVHYVLRFDAEANAWHVTWLAGDGPEPTDEVEGTDLFPTLPQVLTRAHFTATAGAHDAALYARRMV